MPEKVFAYLFSCICNKNASILLVRIKKNFIPTNYKKINSRIEFRILVGK